MGPGWLQEGDDHERKAIPMFAVHVAVLGDDGSRELAGVRREGELPEPVLPRSGDAATAPREGTVADGADLLLQETLPGPLVPAVPGQGPPGAQETVHGAVPAVLPAGAPVGSGLRADSGGGVLDGAPDIRADFRAGYIERAQGDQYLLSLLDHFVERVIGCESSWVLDPGGSLHLGLAQFSPDTWAKARRAPDSDWRSGWEQGFAVASWVSLIRGREGTAAGWPYCFNVGR